ncbi:MAG: RNA polymerase sigma factor [Solirubrobacterales bacterium]
MDGTITAPAAHAPEAEAVAFEQLYRSSRDDLFAYVHGLLRDRSAAEDVTALAFERAFRRRRKFNPSRGNRRAWLFGIARNAALDELRRRKRRADLAEEVADPDAPDPADEAETALRRRALRQAMADLAARERELVALKFFAGLSNAEIAAVVGTSESNAGTRLHRVIEKLRRACDETD